MPAEPYDNDPGPDMPGTPGTRHSPGSPGAAGTPGTPDVPDVLALDLESLRTVDHPVLSTLVSELRERVATPGTQALWGFDNAM
jgi:FXSXX-COOH protein